MRKTFKDISWVGATDFLRTLKMLILLPLLTMSLGPEKYGILTQIKVTVMLLMPFLVLGLDKAIIRFLAGEKDKSVIRNNFLSSALCIFILSLLCASLFYLLSRPLASWLFGKEQLFPLVRVTALLLILYPLDYILIIYFRTFLQMRRYFVFLSMEITCEVFLITFFVLKGEGLAGVLIALVLCKALFLTLKAIKIFSQTGLSIPAYDRLPSFLIFGLPLALADAFYLLVIYGDIYVIRHFLSIDRVGIYSVGYALGMFVVALIRPFEYVLYPKVAAYWNSGEMGKVKVYIRKTLIASVAITTLACFFLIRFAEKIVALITKENFNDASSTIPCLAIGFLILGIGLMSEKIIILLNKTRALLYVYGLLGGFNIALNIILVPRMDIQGAALATLVTFAMYSLITSGMAYKYII